MFQRLLICTDLTDGLQRFVQCADAFATAGVAQLSILYIKPIEATVGVPKLDPSEVETITQTIRGQAPTQTTLPVEVVVKMGTIVEAILQTVTEQQSDLVLLGTASKNPLSESLFGSTTRALAQKTNVPLMIFRPPIIAMMTLEELRLRSQHICRDLLLPYDGSEASVYLVDQIQQGTKLPGEKIEECTLCFVQGENSKFVSTSPEAQMQIVEEKLAPAEAKLSQAGIRLERVIRSGNAVTQILAAAQESDVSAIAIASNSLGKLVEWTTPSLTGELLRRSWYPVLFFPKR
jgi:nucleotide-binding universal stress UspA family protein